MIGKGYQENVTVDEGWSQGYRTQIHFEGDHVITQKTYDREPLSEYARVQRQLTEGTRWGEFQIKGTIAMHDLPGFLKCRTPAERRKWCANYFKQNPDLICNDKYRKELKVA